MKQTIARALLQPDKNFPIDCETIDALQKNAAVVQAIGNVVGDRAILWGCAPEADGTRRGAGYLFVRTRDYPAGEVVWWEGGVVSGGMHLAQQHIRVTTADSVTGQEYDFPQAYTERSMRPGTGDENFPWDDFREPKRPAELEAEIVRLRTEIARLAPPPLGFVQMWAGSDIPEGYALCDGQQLKAADYPELAAALGTTFNSAPTCDGKTPFTTKGYFRLPDLRGRFVVGYSTVDTAYGKYGNAGGAKTHTLKESELPSHTHSLKDFYYLEAAGIVRQPIYGDKEILPGKYAGVAAGSDNDNNEMLYKTHDTASTGGGAAHENRPPYYVLAYIMKLKN